MYLICSISTKLLGWKRGQYSHTFILYPSAIMGLTLSFLYKNVVKTYIDTVLTGLYSLKVHNENISHKYF